MILLGAKVHEGQTVWHRMGDLGFIDPQGYIWFCGRKGERVETLLWYPFYRLL